MIPDHIFAQLKQRQLNYSAIFLAAIAKECEKDTAVLLAKLSATKNDNQSRNYHDRKISNGNLVILIVRDKRPITIFFRRDNQPFTEEALNVDEIKIFQ